MPSSESDDSSLLSRIIQQEMTDFPEFLDIGGVAPLAREGVAAPREKESAATAAGTTTSTVASVGSGTVTIQYSHILLALIAFFILSFAVVAVIRKRSRPKTGFRNRRGPNILQNDSDEDDILISSMYS